MKKIIVTLMIAFILVILVSCKSETASVTGFETSKTGETTSVPEPVSTSADPSVTSSKDFANSVPLEEYKIIRKDSQSQYSINSAKYVKDYISFYYGIDLKISTDEIRRGEEVDEDATEILIGDTNREESSSALEALKAKNCENAFIIKITGNKMIIVGTDDKCTALGVKYFIENYLEKELCDKYAPLKVKDEYISENFTEVTVLPNLVEFEHLSTTKVYGPSESEPDYRLKYTTMVKLKYSEEHKGDIIVTCEDTSKNVYVIRRSTDNGKTFNIISTVREQFAPALYVANWCPSLYELPYKVGDMEKGTLLLSATTRDSNAASVTRTTIWKSTDGGVNWTQLPIVDSGRGGGQGMYEPFLIANEKGELVCFYSDETEVANVHGQRLVYKVSKDGETWSDKKYLIAPEDKTKRPGMPIVTPIADGKYMLVYEMVGLNDGELYFKISDDLTEWGDYKKYGTPIASKDGKKPHATPYIAWSPEGGLNGTLILSSWRMSGGDHTYSDIFLSTDLGKTWYTVDNPLPYEYNHDMGYGYSPCFYVDFDDNGIIYYTNNVNAEYGEWSDMMFAILKIK